MSETFIGRQATLMKAIAKARSARMEMVKQAAMLDDLIESLHADVRQEMRREWASQQKVKPDEA